MASLRSAARRLKQATILTLAAVLSCAEGREGSRAEALTSLIESERAFARSAAELGTRDAFLAYLADDAVLFRPRALNGKEWLSDQPPTPGLLSWEPLYADVAASGDLGFTMGPWVYGREPGDSAARGYYFSVWRKQPDGLWKVVIDHGTASGPPAAEWDSVTVESIRTDDEPTVPVDHSAARAELLEADRTFSAAVRTRRSAAGALDRFVSTRTRLLRERQPPLLVTSLGSLESAWPTPMSWEVLGGDVSSSGTFGYTYGEYEVRDSAGAEALEDGNYMRAWRKGGDGAWRVVVDLMSPVPRTSPQ